MAEKMRRAADNKPKNTRKTLGPIPDLERHLPSNWWQSLFTSLYLKTDGDVVENGDNTRNEIDLVMRALDLGPEDKIMDLCCGQGRHSLELYSRGCKNITGIDRSRYLIRLARRRAKQLGCAIRFREGDARKIPTSETGYDAVLMMGNSFGYFDHQKDDLAVLHAVKRSLKPGGKIAIDMTDGQWIAQHFEPRSWEWIDENHFVCRERMLSEDKDRLVSREVVVHAEKGVIADQIYAERLYTLSRIEKLLKKAGYNGIAFHEKIEARSDRNEDLGMMARRFFLTASSISDTAKLPPPLMKTGQEIVVLLGDPKRPDDVKKDGVFSDLDMQTVARMQESLAKLDKYKFRYLNDHGLMMDSLIKNPPDFVLNLCDEGFDNDPLKELHVPAILEMLNVPYSGAGPAALATCYNKSHVRAIAASCDIPVPLETYFGKDDYAATIPAIFPALIKPCQGDSSVGITREAVVNTAEEAAEYIYHLRSSLPDTAFLIQEFLSGPEYSVGQIGNPETGLMTLPILAVDYSKLDPKLPRIMGYESKWDPESPYWRDISYYEADLPEDVAQNLQNWSGILFERLGCRDYARFDFRTDINGTVKLLEVNPNPGWCWDGKLNFMASYAGHSYDDLLNLIIEAAGQRLYYS